MEICEVTKEYVSPLALVATIGIFEGVHIVHKSLITRCVEEARARGLKSAVITFRVKTNISKNNTIPLLSEEDKILQIERLGIDQLLIFDLDDSFKNLSHNEFGEILVKMNIKCVVVGFDFTYGLNRLGNVNSLKEDTKNMIDLIVVDEATDNGVKIGTTLIKKYLQDGNIKKANMLLGYPFFVRMPDVSHKLLLLKNGK